MILQNYLVQENMKRIFQMFLQMNTSVGHRPAPEIQEIAPSSAVTLHCLIKGDAPEKPDIRFIKDGEFLNERHSEFLESVATDPFQQTLLLRNVSKSTAGTYECSAVARDGHRRISLLKLRLSAAPYDPSLYNEVHCDESLPYCHNGGTCYKDARYGTLNCRCQSEFIGATCDLYDHTIGMTMKNNREYAAYVRNMLLAAAVGAAMFFLVLGIVAHYIHKREKQIRAKINKNGKSKYNWAVLDRADARPLLLCNDERHDYDNVYSKSCKNVSLPVLGSSSYTAKPLVCPNCLQRFYIGGGSSLVVDPVKGNAYLSTNSMSNTTHSLPAKFSTPPSVRRQNDSLFRMVVNQQHQTRLITSKATKPYIHRTKLIRSASESCLVTPLKSSKS